MTNNIKEININTLPEFSILKEMSDIIKKELGNDKNIFLVGGAVRDLFLTGTNDDWDLTGNLLPEEFQKIFNGSITEKFGTVFTYFKKLEIEYTPFRLESDYDGRKPGYVSFEANLENDAQRRDFTMNSLYLDLHNFNLIDLFGGYKDLIEKKVVAVGNPDERFEEDFLRILRGIRLTLKINGTIETNTYQSMINNYKNLYKLSDERIIQEVTKGLKLDQEKYLYLISEYILQNNDINIFGIYNNLYKTELYSIVDFILPFIGGNNNTIKKVKEKDLLGNKFVYLKIREISLDIPENLSVSNIRKLLFDLDNYGRIYNEDFEIFLTMFLNIKLINNEIKREVGDRILAIYKEVIENGQIYNIRQIKEKGIKYDTEELVEKYNIDKKELRNLLYELYIMKQ